MKTQTAVLHIPIINKQAVAGMENILDTISAIEHYRMRLVEISSKLSQYDPAKIKEDPQAIQTLQQDYLDIKRQVGCLVRNLKQYHDKHPSHRLLCM